MKAAVCRAFNEPLVIEELTLEGPQAGELVVDVKACAICHSDITYMDGGWGGALPALYGHEAAGIVSAVGPETPGVQVGDHVVVTLIRSCGQCYYCSRGDRVLCEATLPLSTRQPLKDASGAPVAQMMNVGSFAGRSHARGCWLRRGVPAGLRGDHWRRCRDQHDACRTGR